MTPPSSLVIRPLSFSGLTLGAVFLLAPLIHHPRMEAPYEPIQTFVWKAGLLLAASLWLTSRIQEGFLALRLSLGEGLMGLYLLLGLASVALSPYPYEGWKLWENQLFLVLGALVTANVLKEWNRDLVLGMAGTGLAAVALVGIAQFFGLTNVNWEAVHWEHGLGKRVFSTLGNPNFLADLLVGLLPLAFVESVGHPYPKVRAAWTFAGTSALLCLLYTNSWGGFGAMIAGMMVMALFLWKGRTRLILAWYHSVAGAVLLAGFLEFLWEKGTQVAGETTGLTARIVLWTTAWDLIQERPLLGHGLNAFIVQANRFLPIHALEERFAEVWRNNPNFILRNPGLPHNEFLTIWVELGLPGLLLTAVGLGWFFLKAWKGLEGASLANRRSLIAGTAGLVGLVVQSLSNFPLRTPPGIVVTALGLGLILSVVSPIRGWPMPFRPPERILGHVCLWTATFFGVYWLAQPLFAEAAYTEALQLKEAKRLDEALTALKTSEQWSLLTAEVLFNQASIALEINHLEEAGQALKKIDRVQPFHEYTWFLWGRLSQGQGHLDKAEEDYRKALAFEPRYTAAYLELADLLEVRGAFDEASILLNRAVTLLPGDGGLWNSYGIAAALAGQNAAAKDAWARSLSLAPENPAAGYNARLLSDSEPKGPWKPEHFIGLKAYQWITQTNQSGAVLLNQGKLMEALEAFESITNRYPGYVPALANAGLVLFRLNHKEEARQRWGEALRLQPDHKPTLAFLQQFPQ